MATTVLAGPVPGPTTIVRRRSRARSIGRFWPAFVAAIWLILIIAPQLVARQSPYAINAADSLARPSAAHWFGTDEAGRDVFARCVYGVRDSIGISIAIVLCAATIGSVLGALAGSRQQVDRQRPDAHN